MDGITTSQRGPRAGNTSGILCVDGCFSFKIRFCAISPLPDLLPDLHGRSVPETPLPRAATPTPRISGKAIMFAGFNGKPNRPMIPRANTIPIIKGVDFDVPQGGVVWVFAVRD